MRKVGKGRKRVDWKRRKKGAEGEKSRNKGGGWAVMKDGDVMCERGLSK